MKFYCGLPWRQWFFSRQTVSAWTVSCHTNSQNCVTASLTLIEERVKSTTWWSVCFRNICTSYILPSNSNVHLSFKVGKNELGTLCAYPGATISCQNSVLCVYHFAFSASWFFPFVCGTWSSFTVKEAVYNRNESVELSQLFFPLFIFPVPQVEISQISIY